MSREHGLGVVVGSVNAVAAIGSSGRGRVNASDYTTISRPASLRLAPGEAPRLGAGSAPTGRHGRDVLVDGFVARVGDPVGMLTDDGATYAGEDLMASAVECLVHEATTDIDDPTVVVTHPTAWPRFTVDSLMDALDRAGLPDVTPVAEATAALQWLEGTKGPLADGTVVVYDLGGSSLDITVLRTGAGAGIIGKPIRSDDVCGAQFDHLTMQYVLSHVENHAIDPFDPATEQALRILRGSCSRGKEELSDETETALAVDLPGVHQQVRLVRGELEDLLREPLSVSMTLVREAVYAAGLELRDIDRVLLIGGGAAIPLVAEMVSSDLGLAVVSSDRPQLVSAIGAAMLATDIGSAGAVLASSAAAEPATEAITPGAVALRTPAPVPAPVRPAAIASLPAVEKAGMSRGKKAGFIAAAAVAITVLAAGGLSLGTGGSPAPQSPTSGGTSAATSAPAAPGGTSAAPVAGAPAGNDQQQSGSPAQPGSTEGSGNTGAGGGGSVPTGSATGSNGQQSNGSPAAPGNSPAPAAPAEGAPAPAAPAPVQQQAPPADNGGSAPVQQNPPAQSGGGNNNTPQMPDVNLPPLNAPSLPTVVVPVPTALPVAPIVSQVLPGKLGG
ncbi:Hsp70 family protein [Antrihabitans cavernicola]|nr:Hsp70 family protein [Spelaeibacter cavernicola]